MNNYDFLSKSELSYILNNVAQFDEFTINQIALYCRYKGWKTEKIKAKQATWEMQIGKRLNYDEDKTKIVISQKEKAKKEILYTNIILLVMLFLLLLFISYMALFHDFENKIEQIIAIISIPLNILFLIGLVKKIQFLKSSLSSKKIYHFLKIGELIEINDGSISSKGEIKSVSLFWDEMDDFPKQGMLKIKMKNGYTIIIDEEGGNSGELFQIGLKISKFLNKNLLIFVK